jgi:hypothetical protein
VQSKHACVEIAIGQSMIIPPRLANQQPSRAGLSAEGGKPGRSMHHHHVIHQPDRGHAGCVICLL